MPISIEGAASTFLVWLILFLAGYAYLRMASLDPHNPAALPGRLSRGVWSLLAATSLIISLSQEGDRALFYASFALGTILSPGLNDPFELRRDEEPSWLVRYITNEVYQWTGGLILKVVALGLAWLSARLWEPLWLPVLAVLAGSSIIARTGALLLRAQDPTLRNKDISEAFKGKIPASLASFGEEGVAVLRRASNRKLRKDLPPTTAQKIIQGKRLEDFKDWHRSSIVLPRLLGTLAGLVVWAALGGGLVLFGSNIQITALNYDDAGGMLSGVFVAAFLTRWRQ